MSKLPAIMFYPADWRKDLGVQSLDYFDRGVWFEIICFMHESEKRGKLSINGKPMTVEMLSRLLSLTLEVTQNVVTNLLDFGVMSQDSEGFFICRRMLKDEELRQVRSESGKQGGRPKAKQKQNKSKGLKLPSTRSKAKSKLNAVIEGVNEDHKLIEIVDQVYVTDESELEKLKEAFREKCSLFKVKSTVGLYEKFLEDFKNRKSESNYSGRYKSDLPLMRNWGFRAFFELFVKEQTLVTSLERSNGYAGKPTTALPQSKLFKSEARE